MDQKVQEDVVQYEVKGPIATIWINRPEVKNCVSPRVLDLLGEYGRMAEADPDVRAVVFRGRGNTFCAGADLGQLVGPQAAHHRRFAGARAEIGQDLRPFLQHEEADHLRGRGLCRGRRFRASDLDRFRAWPTTTARIGDFHIRRALFGGAGPIYRLPRYIGLRKSKELMLTGKLLSGVEAKEWGLVNEVAEPDKFDALIEELLRAADRQEPVLHVDDQGGDQPRTGRRHRVADHAGDDDLQRRPPVGRRKGRRERLPGEAPAEMGRPLSNPPAGSARFGMRGPFLLSGGTDTCR